jgi:hypothetical protein
MSEIEPFEADIMRWAALALRRRAERQAKIAADGTTLEDRGVSIGTGEAAIADRLASVLAELATEFEAQP